MTAIVLGSARLPALDFFAAACGTDARYSADPVDLGARSDLIGAPEPMSIEAALTAQADIAHRSRAGGDAP
jgi:hypothetical protein